MKKTLSNDTDIHIEFGPPANIEDLDAEIAEITPPPAPEPPDEGVVVGKVVPRDRNGGHATVRRLPRSDGGGTKNER